MAQENKNETLQFYKIYNVVDMNEETFEIIEKETINPTERQCTVYQIENVGLEYIDRGLKKQPLTDYSKIKAYEYKENIEQKGEKLTVRKIGVYATINDSTDIYEDLWYIKLSVMGEEKDKHIYVNFIRNMNDSLLEKTVAKINDIYSETSQNTKISGGFKTFFDTDNIFKIIRNIAKHLSISKIILQDDAEFPCNNDLRYGIKAVQLRALMPNTDVEPNTWYLPQEKKNEGKGKLSIYQKSGFIPVKYKDVPITGCIKSLREIKCKTLKTTSEQLKKLLTRINDKDITYAIYKMRINEEQHLKIEYEPVKENNYSSICRDYIRNLDLLISIFSYDNDYDEKTIYDYYNKLSTDKRYDPDQRCKIQGDILGCLRNSANRNVIIIKGTKKTEDKDDKNCYGEINQTIKDNLKIQKPSQPSLLPLARSSSEPLPTPTALTMQRTPSAPATITVPNDPIIVTKLFNLFYGTFEKLKYIFFKMELDLSNDKVASAAAP